HTKVLQHTTEIRRDVDEVWATNCQFFQPQAALSATGGITTQYMYRVANPFATILYKTCPNAANRWDVICLFVQPLDPDRCRAHPVMLSKIIFSYLSPVGLTNSTRLTTSSSASSLPSVLSRSRNRYCFSSSPYK